MRTAYVSEDVDHDMTIEQIEQRSLDDVLRWALARADGVVVRLGEDRSFGLGAAICDELPPWPPADLEPLVRRRPADERWKDRTPADPAIAWTVEVSLGVDQENSGRILNDGKAIDAEAAALIARWAPDEHRDADIVDFREEARRAMMRARAIGETGFFTHTPAVWWLTYAVTAPTHALAVDAVLPRLAPPPGWTTAAFAEPAAPPSS